MKYQKTISCVLFLLCIFIYLGCEKDFTPIGNNPNHEKPESKLHLEVIDSDVRETWLHLTIDSTFSADTIEINRYEKIVYRDTMMVRDTVVYDYYFPLTPDPVYHYNAYARQDGRKIQITEPQEAHMLPITSHDYT